MQGVKKINKVWDSIEEGDLIRVSFKDVKGYLEDYVMDVKYGDIYLQNLDDFYFNINEVSSIKKIKQPIKKGDSFIHNGKVNVIAGYVPGIGAYTTDGLDLIPDDAVWIIRNGQVSARLRD